MKVQINPKYSVAKEYIDSIPAIFDLEGQTIDKRRNVLKAFDTQWGKWIVKRYRKPSSFQRFVYTFIRKPKSERAFLYATKLVSLGIDSPEPIADIQVKEGSLFAYGYFVCEMTPDPCVIHYLEDEPDFDRKLAHEVAKFIAETHQKGVRHGDLNLTNIMFRPEGDKWHFSYIDTNRCRFRGKPLDLGESLKDLRRVTHVKPLYDYIIEEYSKVRGLDAQSTLSLAHKRLQRFERWESLKKWYKRHFKSHGASSQSKKKA